MELCINLASKAVGVRAPGIVRSAAQQSELSNMESCINLASEALGVRALGIVRSVAQQPGFLLITIDTQSTPPILFGLHLHSNPQHISKAETPYIILASTF